MSYLVQKNNGRFDVIDDETDDILDSHILKASAIVHKNYTLKHPGHANQQIHAPRGRGRGAGASTSKPSSTGRSGSSGNLTPNQHKEIVEYIAASGKVVGALLGGIIGGSSGPLGGLAGSLIGNNLSSALAKRVSGPLIANAIGKLPKNKIPLAINAIKLSFAATTAATLFISVKRLFDLVGSASPRTSSSTLRIEGYSGTTYTAPPGSWKTVKAENDTLPDGVTEKEAVEWALTFLAEFSESGKNGTETKESTSIVVTKGTDGRARWTLVASGAYGPDKDGEWVTEKGLSDWASAFKTKEGESIPLRFNGEEVALRIWHIGKPDPMTKTKGPGIDIGVCDFAAYINSHLVMSGTFKEEWMADICSKIVTKAGASIGFFHPQNEMGEFNTIDVFEVSLLPSKRASYPFTAFSIQ